MHGHELALARVPRPVLRHGDDDLAACVSLLHAAQALGRVGQRVGPVEDRCELPGLDETGEGEQLLPLLFVRDQSEPLSDETSDGETGAEVEATPPPEPHAAMAITIATTVVVRMDRRFRAACIADPFVGWYTWRRRTD